jgi:hypothetical protein
VSNLPLTLCDRTAFSESTSPGGSHKMKTLGAGAADSHHADPDFL